MFWESGAGYKFGKYIFLDSIFSTNGCVGTHFMDVDVCMHKLKTKQGLHFMHMGADTEKNTIYLV